MYSCGSVVVDSSFIVVPLFVWVLCYVLVCFAVFSVLSSSVYILLGKRQLVALLKLSTRCYVAVSL